MDQAFSLSQKKLKTVMDAKIEGQFTQSCITSSTTYSKIPTAMILNNVLQ